MKVTDQSGSLIIELEASDLAQMHTSTLTSLNLFLTLSGEDSKIINKFYEKS